MCTGKDEKGMYSRIDGFLFEKEGGYQQIAKVYYEKDGKNEIEFLRSIFSSDELVQKVIQETIEMQRTGLKLFGKKVKTNSNEGLCYINHQLEGIIDDYCEEKHKTRNENGDVILSGKIIKYYFILFNDSKTQNGAKNGLWLTEEYFDFID